MLKNRRSSTPTKDKVSPGKLSTTKASSEAGKKTSSSSLKSNGAEVESSWVTEVKETVLVSTEGELGFELLGGADNGQFPVVGSVPEGGNGVTVESGEPLQAGDVLLEAQGQKLSGYTQDDVRTWLKHCLRNRNPLVVRTISKGKIEANCCLHMLSHSIEGGVTKSE